MAEAFGGNNRVLVINPYTPARTEFFATNGTAIAATSKDVGKPVVLDGQYVDMAASGEEIYGFVESVEVGTKNGYNYGGVLCDSGCEVYATDENDNLVVGDLVVAGTPTAVGTVVGTTGANVVKSPAGNVVYTSGGLAIKAGASPTAKTVSTVTALIDGSVVSEAAGDMPALVGTIATGQFNAFAFFLDSAGDLSVAMGTEGATAAAVVLPATPPGSVMIGYVLVGAPTGAAFVGGTTALDVATGSAVYVNSTGPAPVPLAHKWAVVAKYTAGSYDGGVLLRKL